jgi:uncharacterized repeat protein (TIGR02543 family)
VVRATLTPDTIAYTIDIYRKNNNDSLQDITVSNGAINFRPNVYSYVINLPLYIDNITIAGTAADTKATAYNPAAGTLLNRGRNNISIDVYAEDNLYHHTYTIAVNRIIGVLKFAGVDVNIPQDTTLWHQRIAPPAVPVRSGYTFGGWYKEPFCINEWNFSRDTVSVDTLTLYANWIAYREVRFISADGADLGIPPQYVPYGAKVTRPPDPVRSMHLFGGWYKDAACSNAWNFDRDSVTASTTTIYAKWTRYGVVVFTNYVDVADVPQQTLVYGQKAQRPLQDPVREGYFFDGWYKSLAPLFQWNFDIETIHADTTYIYAKWEQGVMVFFKGDSIRIAPKTLHLGEYPKRPQPDPVRSGYRFSGWYNNPEFAVEWNFATMNANKDTTILYGKWTAVPTAVDADMEQTLLVYPTIVDAEFYIENCVAIDGKAAVYNMSGALVGEFDVERDAMRVNIKHLPAGVYVVRCGGKAAKVVKR